MSTSARDQASLYSPAEFAAATLLLAASASCVEARAAAPQRALLRDSTALAVVLHLPAVHAHATCAM